MNFFAGIIAVLMLIVCHHGVNGSTSAPSHPLDGLMPDEYTKIGTILESNNRRTNVTRFSQISLIEPDKAFVKSWVKGETFPRTVVAYIKEGPESYKAILDLNDMSLVSYELASGEGMITIEEFFGMFPRFCYNIIQYF